MGGGGDSSGTSLGDTSQLEDRAKQILRHGDLVPRNVFISFAYEDINSVNLLRGQSKNERSEIVFNDFSVKEPFDSQRGEYIRQKLRERINQCSTTVIYVSGDTAKSQWVEWEVEKSIELGKTVIATHSGDTAPNPIPEFISKKGIKIVPWSKLANELCK